MKARVVVAFVAFSVGLAALVVPLAPASSVGPGHGPTFPERIEVPDGFGPEGIATGRGSAFYVGSIPTGAIYKGDLRTGEGDTLHEPDDPANAIGIAVDSQERLFVAGGPSGRARVIDGATGAVLADYQLTTGPTFVNDVAVAGTDAWFTDSVNAVLYRVPLDLGEAETVPITGDLVYEPGFNANGIDATPDGETLVVVQSNTGRLFTADPDTGATSEIDLGDDTVTQGDGILLHGRTLYVLQNRANLLATVDLAADLSSGVVADRRTHPDFDVPTTLARFGDSLYAVNARFDTPPTSATEYWVTRVDAVHPSPTP